MKEEIIALEKDFKNNEYFGTNVWTEEKYRVLSGNYPVLISAPHSVNQLRGDNVRDAEKYTGALARYLSNACGTYSIFQIFTHADPNNDEEHNYKNAVANLLETYNIKLMLDIHSSTFKDDTDIDIVTNMRESLCGQNAIIEKFKIIANMNGVTVDEKNVPNINSNSEIITVSSFVCGVPAMRLVFNNKKLDVNNEEKLNAIIKTLEEFLKVLNY